MNLEDFSRNLPISKQRWRRVSVQCKIVDTAHQYREKHPEVKLATWSINIYRGDFSNLREDIQYKMKRESYHCSTKQTFRSCVAQPGKFGAYTPRMYGSLKTHKTGLLLQPMLSVINSSSDRLPQDLAWVIESICSLIRKHFWFNKFYVNCDSKGVVVSFQEWSN